MLPNYTYFKLHDPAAHKYNSTLEYRRDLLKRQITLYKNNINTHNNSTDAHSNKVVMYIQKLHHFCNTSSPCDGPKSGIFSLKLSSVWVRKERNDKESMIYLKPKPSKKKNFGNNWSFIMASTKPRP